MEELNPVPAVETTKKELPAEEIYRRNVISMPNRQLSGHLRRKARQQGSMMDGAWATILSTIFDNTASSQVGGKQDAYLR